jgi:cytochrome c
MHVKLRISIVALLLVSGWVLSQEAGAQSGTEVLKTKGCLNCHDFDKKKVGPAFKDVAVKQKGKADELVAKVSGAKGHPKVAASEAEVKAAVEVILGTK